MLDKYLNKKVEIAEKFYGGASTVDGMMNNGKFNRTEGVVTGIDDNFIELDNNMLIAIKFIYRIKLI